MRNVTSIASAPTASMDYFHISSVSLAVTCRWWLVRGPRAARCPRLQGMLIAAPSYPAVLQVTGAPSRQSPLRRRDATEDAVEVSRLDADDLTAAAVGGQLAAGDPAADGPDAEAEQFGGLVGADQL